MRAALFTILALTAWLGWTAALNIPFMPDGLPPAEGLFWPGAIMVAAIAFGLAALSDAMRGSGWVPLASLALGLLTGGLTLRLMLLPLLDTALPLALVGVREALTLFALLYLGFAWWITQQRKHP